MSGPIPQGIEVLVRKASIDPQFKSLLLECRAAAAGTIGLELTASETAMLGFVPVAQLEAIIAQTSVPQEHRRAFLGQAAAAMLAAIGAMAGGSSQAMERLMPAPGGIAPKPPTPPPPPPAGIRPDKPPDAKPEAKPADPNDVEGRVVRIIGARLKATKEQVTRDKSLTKDLGAKTSDLIKIRKEIEKEFQIAFPSTTFGKVQTVGQAIEQVEKTVAAKKPVPKPVAPDAGPPVSRGVRPDGPPLLGGSRPN